MVGWVKPYTQTGQANVDTPSLRHPSHAILYCHADIKTNQLTAYVSEPNPPQNSGTSYSVNSPKLQIC